MAAKTPFCAAWPECSGFVMVPKLALTPLAIDTVMPTMSIILSAGIFISRALATAAAVVPTAPVDVPAAVAPGFWLGTVEPPGDLGGDDEGSEHFRRRRPGRFRNRQDGGDDRGDRLAGHVGEIVIHGVAGDAVGERGELRRRAQRWPTMVAAGAVPSSLMMSQTMSAGGSGSRPASRRRYRRRRRVRAR